MGIKTVNLVALRMLYALKILIFSRAVKKLKKKANFHEVIISSRICPRGKHIQMKF